jgi:6-phosphogluconolactonase
MRRGRRVRAAAVLLASLMALLSVGCKQIEFRTFLERMVYAPGAPQGITAVFGNGKVTLDWTAMPDAESYSLYWSTTGTVTTSDSRIGVASPPYVHQGLSNYTSYSYMVTATRKGVEGGSSSTVTAMPSEYAKVFVYGVNKTDKTISVFSMDIVTGALSLVETETAGLTEPRALAVAPNGAFAYAANYGSPGCVSVYRIDAITGALTLVGSPVSGGSPVSICVTPDGSCVYAANWGAPGNVALYKFDGNGAIVSGPTPYTAGSDTIHVLAHPMGSYVYALNNGDASASVYSITPSTGALTPVQTAASDIGASPWAAVIDPAGKYYCSASYGTGTVRVHSIATGTGMLSYVGYTTVGSQPMSAAMDPSGRFLFVANSNSWNVSAFSLNSTTGALTLIENEGEGISLGNPRWTSTDPTGRFLLTACDGGGNPDFIATHAIDTSIGQLTYRSSAPISATGDLAHLAVLGFKF